MSSTPTSGTYDPASIEPAMYEFWEQRGAFHADPDPQRRPFSIVIPPPNVTGALHLGHALNNTLQDMLIRNARMRGFNACWLPGTDHAGIATQAVVEKRLREEQKLSRHEIGREGLVKKIWEWKEEYGGRILNQLRRMGCSCDWRRTRFTLDEGCVQAVYELFFRWFRDGLIYRGQRLVNWDTQLQTAVADDEVYHETVKGHLWHVRYPIVGGKGSREPGNQGAEAFVIVATTRPETMLADTAVAVHPADERYQHLIGKRLVLPLTGRTIPVIADDVLVSRDFGTGCVKVTPGHDPNDYACWQRKQGQPDEIDIRNMMTPDGRVHADNAGEPAGAGQPGRYAGLKLDEARKQVVADLEAAGLIEKIEPYETDIGHSDRSKTAIQPYLSEQWFVRMESLCELAMEAVRDGRVTIFPERFAKSYLDWLGEKRDWCISRQLWWGHRIPVWRFPVSMSAFIPPNADWTQFKTWKDAGLLVMAGLPERRDQFQFDEKGIRSDFPSGSTPITGHFCPAPSIQRDFEVLAQKLGLEQDPDVLDTWFSSQLWPFSTFGWPTKPGLQDQGTTGSSPSDSGSSPDSSIPQSLATSKSQSMHPACPGDLAYFYPTSVLSTARDIISLWVARMVMSGLYCTGRVPFQHVCIHPTIQDGQGRRMSKSLGNGVDPLDLIEMYGADAMRFTLASLAGDTQDIRIPVKPATLPDGRTVNTSERFELGRNFCNKLWQAATGFVLPNLGGEADRRQEEQGPRDQGAKKGAAAADLTLALEDRWILSRLSECVARFDRALASYAYNEAATAVYDFFWSEFCDWYVEWVKPRLFEKPTAAGGMGGDKLRSGPDSAASAATARRVLAFVLDQSLRVMHPIMPFITEALWQKLNDAAPRRGLVQLETQPDALINAPWPDAAAIPRDLDVEREMRALQDIIRAVREIRARINALRSQEKQPAIRTLPRAVVRTDAAMSRKLLGDLAVLRRLGQCDEFEIGPEAVKPADAFSTILTGVEVYVPVAGLANLAIERQRLRQQLEELRGHAQRVEAKLANEGFVAKAAPAVVERERARLAELREQAGSVERNLRELGEN